MAKEIKTGLQKAKEQKKDEFYTQLTDIESELKHYRDQFRDKVVFCNCDDPYESNFFKYFANNFNFLGLKKLITTSYSGSPIAGGQLPLADIEGLKPNGKLPFVVEITEVPDHNNDGAVDIADVELLLRLDKNTARPLIQSGDFRSTECVELLKQSDIVCTNPPFSLFREYVAQLMEHDKQFLIIGNVNAITYQDCFELIKNNKMWLGVSIHSGDREFRVPDDYPLNAAGFRVDDNGNKYIRVKGVRWYTNLDTAKRHDTITLYKRYNQDDYQKYDNYDAIDVGFTADIPFNYPNAMGVPITFLDKYNPDQFEILGWTRGREEYEIWPTKKYVNARQIKDDGTESGGGKVNTGPTLLLAQRPAKGTVYVADGVDGYLVQTYMRIIIRNRYPEEENA